MGDEIAPQENQLQQQQQLNQETNSGSEQSQECEDLWTTVRCRRSLAGSHLLPDSKEFRSLSRDVRSYRFINLRIT